MKPKISIIGPSHRTKLWIPFYESIVTNLDFEVIFVTDVKPKISEIPGAGDTNHLIWEHDDTHYSKMGYKNFRWIYSKVKPAQCFEIAYRKSYGDFIVWTGDDFTYGPYALDHAYAMHKSFYDHKVMVSFNVHEDGRPVAHHQKLPWDDTHQLTTTALISKKAIEEAGGFADSTFCCGHFDVDLQMRIWANGGRMFVCPPAMAYEPHEAFHKQEANFATTWREELEYFTELWQQRWNGETSTSRQKPFIPYTEENILTISQGRMKGKWQ